MERILVTGGTGYIGSHTIIELYKKGYEIDVLDNLFNSKITVLDKIEEIAGKRPNFYEIDLLDMDKMDKLFEDNKYDLVIHFAGLKAVGESVEKPLKYYDNNVGGTINLLKCMQKHDVEKIIFSSSATVYGEQPVAKLDETMPTGLGITNPYGETKHMIEEILKDVAESDPKFEAVILRYFNPVGNHSSGLLGEDPNDIPNNLMPVIVSVCSGKSSKLTVFGDDYDTPDGTCIRDYIHVVDLAKGHLKALSYLLKNPGCHIFNLGTGHGTSVLELINIFEKVNNIKVNYEIGERREGDLPVCFASCEKAYKVLGWKASLTVEDMCKSAWNWALNKNTQ